MNHIKSAFLALAITGGIAASAQAIPEGDQFVASLGQAVDQLNCAASLLKRDLSEGRDSDETAHSMEVFADAFDHLTAHAMQFYAWAKTAKPEDFSPAAIDQIKVISASMAQNYLPEVPQQTLDYYMKNPQFVAAVNRFMAAFDMLSKLRNGQVPQGPLSPESARKASENLSPAARHELNEALGK